MDEATIKQLGELTSDVIRLQESQKANSKNIATITTNISKLVEALQPMGVLQSKLNALTDTTKELADTLMKLHTHEMRIARVEKLVYGAVGLILVSVATAILVSVIPQKGF